ncbi:MAG: hypothetical protein ACRD1G_08415, partial [Acidimicrobiales bacterium]
MTVSVLDLADRLWRGETSVTEHHPVGSLDRSLEEVAPGVGFIASFANVSVIATGDGLVLVDTGSPFTAGTIHAHVRE